MSGLVMIVVAGTRTGVTQNLASSALSCSRCCSASLRKGWFVPFQPPEDGASARRDVEGAREVVRWSAVALRHAQFVVALDEKRVAVRVDKG